MGEEGSISLNLGTLPLCDIREDYFEDINLNFELI